MVNIERTRVSWYNVPGGTAVSTFYFLNAAEGQASLHTFFTAIKQNIPDSIAWHFETGGDSIDVTDGKLVGAWSAAPPADVVGTGAGVWSAPVGLQVRWETGEVFNGHRVRGRTYIVPCAGVANDGGTIDDIRLANIVTVGTALANDPAGNMQVWSRPRKAVPTWTDKRGKVHDAIAAQAGGAFAVLTATAPDRAAVLTSRRG